MRSPAGTCSALPWIRPDSGMGAFACSGRQPTFPAGRSGGRDDETSSTARGSAPAGRRRSAPHFALQVRRSVFRQRDRRHDHALAQGRRHRPQRVGKGVRAPLYAGLGPTTSRSPASYRTHLRRGASLSGTGIEPKCTPPGVTCMVREGQFRTVITTIARVLAGPTLSGEFNTNQVFPAPIFGLTRFTVFASITRIRLT